MIEKFLNRVGDWFVRHFPGKSKDDDLVNGFIVIFCFCVTGLALFGTILQWAIGVPWWICFPLVILYWLMVVIYRLIQIKRRDK